jgi:hypothetical protein
VLDVLLVLDVPPAVCPFVVPPFPPAVVLEVPPAAEVLPPWPDGSVVESLEQAVKRLSRGRLATMNATETLFFMGVTSSAVGTTKGRNFALMDEM